MILLKMKVTTLIQENHITVNWICVGILLVGTKSGWLRENCSINKLTHFAALDVGDCRRICDYWALFNMKRYGVIKIRCGWRYWGYNVPRKEVWIFRSIEGSVRGTMSSDMWGIKRLHWSSGKILPRKSKGNSQDLRRHVNTQFNKFSFYRNKNQTSVTRISRDQI